MTSTWPGSLVLAGAGKMGSALLRSWVGGGLSALAIHVLDPALDAETTAYCDEMGVSRVAPTEPPHALVLAVKPQTFLAMPNRFAAMIGPETMVISILAGVTLARLREHLPQAGAIVRAMPNLPAAVGKGATALASEPRLSDEQRAIVSTLLRAAGHVEWLDEDLIDAVTAVSGSGPAYVFLLAECLAEAGTAAGLPPDIAERLARATVEGAGALMASQPLLSPAALRVSVTSPNGTTAAALAVLRADDGMRKLLVKAVAEAKRRAAELAG